MRPRYAIAVGTVYDDETDVDILESTVLSLAIGTHTTQQLTVMTLHGPKKITVTAKVEKA